VGLVEGKQWDKFRHYNRIGSAIMIGVGYERNLPNDNVVPVRTVPYCSWQGETQLYHIYHRGELRPHNRYFTLPLPVLYRTAKAISSNPEPYQTYSAIRCSSYDTGTTIPHHHQGLTHYSIPPLYRTGITVAIPSEFTGD